MINITNTKFNCKISITIWLKFILNSKLCSIITSWLQLSSFVLALITDKQITLIFWRYRSIIIYRPVLVRSSLAPNLLSFLSRIIMQLTILSNWLEFLTLRVPQNLYLFASFWPFECLLSGSGECIIWVCHFCREYNSFETVPLKVLLLHIFRPWLINSLSSQWINSLYKTSPRIFESTIVIFLWVQINEPFLFWIYFHSFGIVLGFMENQICRVVTTPIS